MNYLWTEDTGAGLHFWNLVNQIFFDDKLIVESKKSNQGILDAVSNLELKKEDKYYIAFDYIVDNQDIRNKYRLLKLFARKSDGQIIILDMICFEYLVLAFEKLVQWTGTGKINLEKIKDGKTLKYLTGFKKYSTERVMKSLAGELTENEKWSIRGTLMGECWYQDCCVSEHPDSLRCGIPETKKGNERIKLLIQSEEVQKVLLKIVN